MPIQAKIQRISSKSLKVALKIKNIQFSPRVFKGPNKNIEAGRAKLDFGINRT